MFGQKTMDELQEELNENIDKLYKVVNCLQREWKELNLPCTCKKETGMFRLFKKKNLCRRCRIDWLIKQL
jgi:hypothetical protein